MSSDTFEVKSSEVQKNFIQLSGNNCVLPSRYMNGAATNPDAHVVARAGAQVKKGLDIAKKLNAENFGKHTQI